MNLDVAYKRPVIGLQAIGGSECVRLLPVIEIKLKSYD